MPLILADVFAVNKIYRRAFWQTVGLEFPVDTRYEDQPTSTKAFLAADRFDVIPETVYFWRRRHDNSSITQNRHHLGDLLDRMSTKRESTELVMAAHPEFGDVWFGDILPVDMWEYFAAASTACDEYWTELTRACDDFWHDGTMAFTSTTVPAAQRLMGWLVQQDRRGDLARLVEYLRTSGWQLPVEVHRGVAVSRLSGCGLSGDDVPTSARVLAEHETGAEVRVLSAGWVDEAVLRLTGFALVNNVATSGRDTSLMVRLAAPNGRVLEVAARHRHEPLASSFVGKQGQDYADCGFEVDLQLADLERLCPPAGPEADRWQLCFERRVDTLTRVTGVTGHRRPAVDCRWHSVSRTVMARLVGLDGGLALELCQRREVEPREIAPPVLELSRGAELTEASSALVHGLTSGPA